MSGLKSKTNLRDRTAEKMREAGDFSGNSLNRRNGPATIDKPAPTSPKPEPKGKPGTRVKGVGACVREEKAKPTHADLEKEADTLFSLRIRTAADFRCLNCGFNGAALRWFMHCAHVVRRGFHAVRWTDSNAVCLCKTCADKFTRAGVTAWKNFLLTLGIDYDALRVFAEKGAIPNVEDVIANLKAGRAGATQEDGA